MTQIIEGYGVVDAISHPPLKMAPEIVTIDGSMVNFLDPDPATLTDRAIARGLSNECRFAGQMGTYNTPIFYSVAQHSVNVAKICHDAGLSRAVCLQALYHDATEAFMKDIPSPLKQLFPLYKKLEKNMLRVILEARGLEFPLYNIVERADQTMLVSEAKKFLVDAPGNLAVTHGYPSSVKSLAQEQWYWQPWRPEFAEAQWLAYKKVLEALPS